MYLIFGTEQRIEELRGKAGKALVHMTFKVICQKIDYVFLQNRSYLIKKNIV